MENTALYSRTAPHALKSLNLTLLNFSALATNDFKIKQEEVAINDKYTRD